MTQSEYLPDSRSKDIHLTHPTNEEKVATWALNSAAWSGALTQAQYLERESFLTTIPLAKDGGITHWILVDQNQPANRRQILGSCETLRKRALVSKNGQVTEIISHGIGSVFCDPRYRGRGYASRMMMELGEVLKSWQADSQGKRVGFSFLYSDIGKAFYADHGWLVFPSTHLEFAPSPMTDKNSAAALLREGDLQKLCADDEKMIRKRLLRTDQGVYKTCVALIPDHDQMQWHHQREDFFCNLLFGLKPDVKGAIVGEPGHRMWAIWTRSFYGPLDIATSGNTLHILRLVVEDETPPTVIQSNKGEPPYDEIALNKQAESLSAIVQRAQAEAMEWKLQQVELWNPSPLVQLLVERGRLPHHVVERDDQSITSLMWYGEGSGNVEELEWVGNEKFGWC